jgi:hypothetical protein
VDPSAGLKDVEKIKLLSLPGLDRSAVQPLASRYELGSQGYLHGRCINFKEVCRNKIDAFGKYIHLRGLGS